MSAQNSPIEGHAPYVICAVMALGLLCYRACATMNRPVLVQPSGPVQIVAHFVENPFAAPGYRGHNMIVYREDGHEKRLPFYGNDSYEKQNAQWQSIEDGQRYRITIGYDSWIGKDWPRIIDVQPSTKGQP